MDRDKLKEKVEFIKNGLDKGVELHLACTPTYDYEGSFSGLKTFFIEDYPLRIIIVGDPLFKELQFASLISYEQVRVMDSEISDIVIESDDYFTNLDTDDTSDYHKRYEKAKKPATEIWYDKLEKTLIVRSKQIKEMFKINSCLKGK